MASLELVSHYLLSVRPYKINDCPQLLPLEMSRHLDREKGSGFVTWAVDLQFLCRSCTGESLRDTGEAGTGCFEPITYCRAAGGSALCDAWCSAHIAAVIKDSSSLTRQGGLELSFCSCVWPEVFPEQVAQNQTAAEPGGKGIAKVTHERPWGLALPPCVSGSSFYHSAWGKTPISDLSTR